MTHPAPARRAAAPAPPDAPPEAPSADYLVALLDSAYHGPAWHGPSLRATLRGVDAERAEWRPAPGRHSIWELVVHAAYARYRVARRLDPGRTARFARPLTRPWWPGIDPAPDGRPAAWERDRALLDDQHRQLVEVVRAMPAERLRRVRRGARHTLADEVVGVALHDVYHAGQIRLLGLRRA